MKTTGLTFILANMINQTVMRIAVGYRAP